MTHWSSDCTMRDEHVGIGCELGHAFWLQHSSILLADTGLTTNDALRSELNSRLYREAGEQKYHGRYYRAGVYSPYSPS
jgi:hypothetical protein